MSERSYSDEELQNYFNNRKSRSDTKGSKFPIYGFWKKRLGDERKVQAASFLSYIAVALIAVSVLIGGYFLSLIDELPPLTEIENPEFQLATIAYTADGKELARFARQNRSWVTYDNISPHVINALWATEDHRFYDHWGLDIFRTISSVGQTVLAKLYIPGFDTQGGSTISQQLARNLYNTRIGREQTVGRKLKEMVTAVQLERRYTKAEILEMYLNTVEFGGNSFGIEAGARTFFGKAPFDLNESESAMMVGMLKGTTFYNPVRNPERARQRRNVVLSQMIKRDLLDPAYLEEHRADSVGAVFLSSAITQSLAPHFAEAVRKELVRWSDQNGMDIYDDGLIVYTTLDSRMQAMAQIAVNKVLPCLEAVADWEWSEKGTETRVLSESACVYLDEDIDPWSAFWKQQPTLLRNAVKNSDRYRREVGRGANRDDLLGQLMADPAYMDSIKAEKTRLETGFVAMDPQTGFIKAWIGGRQLDKDWYDHVSIAERQAGSTFKPFVYTAAIDLGYDPYMTLVDDSVRIIDGSGNVWSPGNFGDMSGLPMTLKEGLAQSKNTISAQLIELIGPYQAAFYARRMGISTPLMEVPSLALGTSDVKLLEMTSAYSTFANGGLLYKPTLIWRIEDRMGNLLYEAQSSPREALSEATAYTMADMLRAVIRSPQGSGIQMRYAYNLGDYDIAGKTGTTQNAADTWFMLIHPDLVVGNWIGFNDPAFTFRTRHWGQGARTALHVVGRFMRQVADSPDNLISKDSRFPTPNRFFDAEENAGPADSLVAKDRRNRLDW
ncbi:transglycosylase domain-containing protein [bacterium]|nr:transglycosylase domain-containing protein [bacterium]